MKKIGVLTSGGDSPGMNACIRSVVRTAIHNNLKVCGILYGYEGMINGEIEDMDRSSVANIIQRGGTILKTARCEEFRTVEGRQKAYKNLVKHKVDAVVVIGGDGTFTGANIFSQEHNIPFMGIPGTIDNDLYGTDFAIGYDTAINTVVDAVDKIRDTASSHNRLFFIEVMGRDAGFIALRSGIGAGAEAIMVPETASYVDEYIDKLKAGYFRKKETHIVMVAEGDETGGAQNVADRVKRAVPEIDVRVTVLGHIQRGGSPSAMDRVLASRLGMGAVDALLKGRKGEMVGIVNDNVQYTPFSKAIKHHITIKKDLLNLIEILSI